MRTKIIVNPRSGGHGSRKWTALEKRLVTAFDDFDVEFTTGPGAASEIAARSLRDGFERIVAVGGDGTLSETVNGFFEGERPIAPEAVFAFVMTGRGNDFRKSWDIAGGTEAAVRAASTGEIRRIDLGRLRYRNHAGQEETRTFLNIASCGISGEVDRGVNRTNLGRYVGGTATFLLISLGALLRYHNRRVRLQVDDVFDETFVSRLILVCNGRYAGGGMKFNSGGDLADGLLDVVALGDISALRAIRDMPRLYTGRFAGHPEVTQMQGRRVTITPVDEGGPIHLDVDGENPGTLPAVFEVVPGALRIQV